MYDSIPLLNRNIFTAVVRCHGVEGQRVNPFQQGVDGLPQFIGPQVTFQKGGQHAAVVIFDEGKQNREDRLFQRTVIFAGSHDLFQNIQRFLPMRGKHGGHQLFHFNIQIGLTEINLDTGRCKQVDVSLGMNDQLIAGEAGFRNAVEQMPQILKYRGHAEVAMPGGIIQQGCVDAGKQRYQRILPGGAADTQKELLFSVEFAGSPHGIHLILKHGL